MTAPSFIVEEELPVEGDLLTRIAAAADQAIDLKNELSKAQAEVDRLSQKEKTLLRTTIPDLMKEAGNMKSFSTKDGFSIIIKDEIQAAITAEKSGEALAWLEAHDFGGLIKTKVEMNFGRDEAERELRDKAIEALKELHVAPVVKEAVHPATLKAFVKEQLAKPMVEGEDRLPLETFGVFQYTVAELKAAKTKGKKS